MKMCERDIETNKKYTRTGFEFQLIWRVRFPASRAEHEGISIVKYIY